jgi:hypothetical protein
MTQNLNVFGKSNEKGRSTKQLTLLMRAQPPLQVMPLNILAMAIL